MSGIIITLIKLIFLTEKNLLEIKNIKDKNQIPIKSSKIIDSVKRKCILLFVINFTFLFFFWFYVGLFCAVFRNTQVFLIVITLLSFILYLLYPFVLCLLPAAIRISAISSCEKKSQSAYRFSQIIEMII